MTLPTISLADPGLLREQLVVDGAWVGQGEIAVTDPATGDVLGHVPSADAALKQCTVKLELSPNLPSVEGDRIHLQQVILNLIMNALEAMTKQAAPKRLVTVRTRTSDDGEVMITVADSGAGIDPANQPYLFDPFFTTKPNGMGMGLAICHQIIEAHKGRVRAENQTEGGALFTVTLPARTGQAA